MKKVLTGIKKKWGLNKMRKGMGRGQGSGWKNLRCDDSRRHSLASRGIKTAQKVPSLYGLNEKTNTPNDLRYKNYGMYLSETISGRDLDKHMEDVLDLKNHKDYEYVTNQTFDDGKPLGVLFLMSFKGVGRWQSSLGLRGFSRTSDHELSKKNYGLFKYTSKGDTR